MPREEHITSKAPYIPARLVDADGNEVKTTNPCREIRLKHRPLYLQLENRKPVYLCSLCQNLFKCMWRWNATRLDLFFTVKIGKPRKETNPVVKFEKMEEYRKIFYQICFENRLPD